MATAYFAFSAYYMLRHGPRTRFSVMLGCIFVWWAFSNAKDIVLAIPGWHDEQMQNIITLIDGWSAVTFACLLFELSMPGWVTLKRIALLAMPFAAFSLAYVICRSSVITDIYIGFLMTFGLLVSLVGYHKAKGYIRYAYENYSNVDDIDITWVRRVCLMAIPIQMLWAFVSLVVDKTADSMFYIVTIGVWQSVVHYCRDLKQVAVNVEQTEEAAKPGMRAYPFASELERIVEEDRLYENPNLSLADLTTRIGTNRTYLSDYFSNVKRVTFYDYINELRINRISVPLLTEHPEYTMEYIATKSGFNSLSTFRRAFKKFTGKTPKDFRTGSEG